MVAAERTAHAPTRARTRTRTRRLRTGWVDGQATNQLALRAGMTLSNEPGYYEDGSFGVRHENVLVVTAAAALENCAVHSEYLSFESLTVAPFQVRAPPPPHGHTHGTGTRAHARTPAPPPVGLCSRMHTRARAKQSRAAMVGVSRAVPRSAADKQTNKQSGRCGRPR